MSSAGMKPPPGVGVRGATPCSEVDGLSLCKGSVCDDAIPSPEDACLDEDDDRDWSSSDNARSGRDDVMLVCVSSLRGPRGCLTDHWFRKRSARTSRGMDRDRRRLASGGRCGSAGEIWGADADPGWACSSLSSPRQSLSTFRCAPFDGVRSRLSGVLSGSVAYAVRRPFSRWFIEAVFAA